MAEAATIAEPADIEHPLTADEEAALLQDEPTTREDDESTATEPVVELDNTVRKIAEANLEDTNLECEATSGKDDENNLTAANNDSVEPVTNKEQVSDISEPIIDKIENTTAIEPHIAEESLTEKEIKNVDEDLGEDNNKMDTDQIKENASEVDTNMTGSDISILTSTADIASLVPEKYENVNAEIYDKDINMPITEPESENKDTDEKDETILPINDIKTVAESVPASEPTLKPDDVEMSGPTEAITETTATSTILAETEKEQALLMEPELIKESIVTMMAENSQNEESKLAEPENEITEATNVPGEQKKNELVSEDNVTKAEPERTVTMLAENDDAEMTDVEPTVTMEDVLKEQEELEDNADAVLGASDDKNCTYSEGYVKRQALYACITCCVDAKSDPTKRAGVCLACSLACHENHELVELYTKRDFRCDCGNPKFTRPCILFPEKPELNLENKYDQNFSGLYCICHRPYPDPENQIDDEMIQCIICEDWLHSAHLDATVPANDQYEEMICKGCMEKNDFLNDYTDYAVYIEDNIVVDVEKINGHSEEFSDKIGTVSLKKEMETTEEKMEENGTETERKLDDTNELGDVTDAKKNESEKCDNVKENEKPNEENALDSPEIQTDITASEGPGSKENTDTETVTAEQIIEESNEKLEVVPSEKEKVDITNDTNITENIEVESVKERELSVVQNPEEKPSIGENPGKDIGEVAQGDVPSISSNEDISKETDVVTIEPTEETQKDDEVTKESSESHNENTPEEKETHKDLQLENNLNEDSEMTDVTSEEDKVKENTEHETPTDVADLNVGGMEMNEDNISKSGTDPTSIKEKTCEDAVENINNIDEDVEMKEPELQTDSVLPNNNKIGQEPEKLTSNAEASTDSALQMTENTDQGSTSEVTEEKREDNISEESEITDTGSKDYKIEENTTEVAFITENDITDTLHINGDVSEPKDSHKRKLSTEQVHDIDVSVKKTKLKEDCRRPKSGKKFKGATFWPCSWRQKLCSCHSCVVMYRDNAVLFLLDLDDTVSAYEDIGKANNEGKGSQYEKGLAALSSLGRVGQINALTEYNRMKDKLLDFLKGFKDKQEVVKEEDIREFFADMKPRKEPDGVYFCR